MQCWGDTPRTGSERSEGCKLRQLSLSCRSQSTPPSSPQYEHQAVVGIQVSSLRRSSSVRLSQELLASSLDVIIVLEDTSLAQTRMLRSFPRAGIEPSKPQNAHRNKHLARPQRSMAQGLGSRRQAEEPFSALKEILVLFAVSKDLIPYLQELYLPHALFLVRFEWLA